MLVIGDSSTRLRHVAERRDRVAELDAALLARRRRDDLLQLNDRLLHREIERRCRARRDGDGLLLLADSRRG